MAKKTDNSLFINFFLQFTKEIGLFINFQGLIIHYSLFFGSLFTIHYKKGHYSLIIIPHPDPHAGHVIIRGAYHDIDILA